MAVELHFRGNDVFPGGFKSTFNTVEEATAQALADLESKREPGPDRITDGDSIVMDRQALEALLD